MASKRRRIHVLLIEDNSDEALSLKMVLEMRPEVEFTVEWAATMASALTRLERGGIDAVLLDLTLPDAAGPHLVERVKATAPDAGLIVYTGRRREDVEAPATAAGADSVLQKPAEAAEISQRLQFAVIRHRTAAERREFEQVFGAIGDVVNEMGGIMNEVVEKDGGE